MTFRPYHFNVLYHQTKVKPYTLTMKTQNERILNHLQKGRKITPLQALDKFDCFRLSARINEIRNDGYPVQRDTVKTKSGKHVARYYLNL